MDICPPTPDYLSWWRTIYLSLTPWYDTQWRKTRRQNQSNIFCAVCTEYHVVETFQISVLLSFMCWLHKLLAARPVDEFVMLFIVGCSRLVFNKVEFVHMWEEQLPIYLIATCHTLMGDFPLGFREVIPDQTVPEKWKELTLNTGQVHVSHSVLNL